MFLWVHCAKDNFTCEPKTTPDLCLLKNQFNGVILIRRSGEKILHKAYGKADTQRENTLESKFRIGSLSKTFTSAAIILLAKDSLLDLNDPLSKYYTGFEHGDEVTLKQLITHTSGIGDFDQADFKKYLFKKVTLNEMVDVLRTKKCDFKPGKKFKYNNGGYLLLGGIVEIVSGIPYLEYLQKEIFIPLGMQHTGYADYDQDITNLSQGHLPGFVPDESLYNYSMLLPIGGLFSTLPDLELWVKSRDSLLRLSLDSERTLGWASGDRFSKNAYWHSGITNGYSSFIFKMTGEDSYLILLSNEGRKPGPIVTEVGSLVY